jgi:hypothetical protein
MESEEHATAPLAGGIMGNGYQCGMLWGAALAAGAQAYRRLGPGPQAEAEAILISQNLVNAFRARTRNINCFEITEMNFKSSSGRALMAQTLKFFLRGGPIACFSTSASYARVAFKGINTANFNSPIQAPLPPVSCAAALARRMGASDIQAAMAAGLAGGIGLNGGACGALGTAVWLTGLKRGTDVGENNALFPSWGEGLVQSFLESSDYEFECARIVGRKFASVEEHAAYLGAGGCAQIIEALAKQAE